MCGIYYGRENVGMLAAHNALLLATTLNIHRLERILLPDRIGSAWPLTAYCLVGFGMRRAARSAGRALFRDVALGTGCLILGFLLLFGGGRPEPGDYGFDTFRALGDKLSPGRRDAAFLLFLFGFGVKAGIVPLHIWLPRRVRSPEQRLGLLSGVLIKPRLQATPRAVRFHRHAADLVGVTVLDDRDISAVLGSALRADEHDLKRCSRITASRTSASSSIGLGGVPDVPPHTHHPVLATLALIAGLYTPSTTPISRPLLFLGAHAVLARDAHAEHGRDERLMKRMPKTALSS